MAQHFPPNSSPAWPDHAWSLSRHFGIGQPLQAFAQTAVPLSAENSSLTAYHPSWRDRIAGWIMGDSRETANLRRNAVQGLLGSTGLGATGPSLVDFAPGGGLLGAQEALREGDYQGAALSLMPGGNTAKLAIFGGMAARTFPRAQVKIAQEMKRAGRAEDEIWRQTGLARGIDTKWRFEIPDTGFQVRPDVGDLERSGFRVAPVFEHYVHPGLQQAYPELATTPSRMKIDPDQIARAGFDPYERRLINRAPTMREAEDAGIEELQHLVQLREDFPRGATLDELRQGGMSEQEARELYRHFAGEVEAKNAVRRLRMSEEERRAKLPRSTEEIPWKLQRREFYEPPWE